MLVLKVKGMNCNHCVRAIEQAVCRIDGVASVRVDLDKAEVRYTGSAAVAAVSQAIADAGYTVSER
tara:strand:+ start:8368 stop:8565 length:198 start_codon:yes stop_codon:yes gene_type:complete